MDQSEKNIDSNAAPGNQLESTQSDYTGTQPPAAAKPGKGLGGAEILNYWQRLNRLPGGRFLFERLLGFRIPYTGSIRPRIETLNPGHAVVQLKERRRVRNHLKSIHAIALANLAELTTGLATLSGMPASARGILIGLEISYLKKARGTITGTCHCDIPETSERREYKVPVTLRDEDGDIVVEGKATWLIGPRPG